MTYKSENNKTWIEDDNGKQIAILEYPEVKPGLVNIVHTEVVPEMNGQGLAGKITEYVAKELRKQGIKAELTCSYSIKWFSKHSEYNDILSDPEAEAKKTVQLAGPACGIQRK